MVQELNKIAIIHLFILGFHDELNNFTLNLTNPSTQGEMLKVEQWKEKVLLYKDLVGQVDGISPTSHTWAKKNIFNWTDEDIKIDMERQMMERAAAKELEATPENIKKTGIFDRVTKLYGEIGTPATGGGTAAPEAETGGEAGGEAGGFGGFGGGTPELGGAPEIGGGEEATPEAGAEVGGFGEGFRNQSKSIIDKLLMDGISKNEDIMLMTEGIKDLIGEDDSFNEEDYDDSDLLQNS